MRKVKEYVNSYFELNETILSSSYPGITKHKLLQEFLNYSHLKAHEIYLGQSSKFFLFLKEGYPLEYIQRSSYFYKSNFYVDKNVLIPRSETEILVEDSINFITKKYHDTFSIAEIGVGSFCIGLSILAEVNKSLIFEGYDICTKAIDIANVNYFRLSSKINPLSKVLLSLNDRLENINTKYDFIVSNPPYIKLNIDKIQVHDKVDQYEPSVALYIDDDKYTSWFEEFFKQVSNCLLDGGAFFMEGHEDHLKRLESIAKKYFNKTEIKKDYTHRDRFLHSYK